ncbi:unnamed protein product [Amoebophrya sp. A120]|nr:unnamed protein product [Amoebophrya sp. A120]|eukprot:GSA120T00017643001.1
MAARSLTSVQIKDAYDLYVKGFECGVPAEDTLELALNSLCLNPKLYLKPVREACIKKDHEGKEMKIAFADFENVVQEQNTAQIESGVDVREMFDKLARGGKLDLDRVRELCTPMGFRDTDVENMFEDYAGDVGLVTEDSLKELVQVIRESR